MATDSLKFRVASQADAALLQVLVRSAYRGEESRQGWTTEADLLTGDRIDLQGIMAKINEPNGAVLVAADENNNTIACCEVLQSNDDSAYFGMFAVDPLRQGGGLGRRVLAYAENYCRQEWGVKSIEMTVIWTRHELISWYIRRGYRLTGKTKPFPYEHLVHDVPLRHDLYFQVLEKTLDTVSGTAP